MKTIFKGQDIDSLSDQERNAFQAMVENYPNGGILAIHTYPNLDATDEEEAPVGCIVVHPENAQVNPDSIREQMFSYLGIAKLKPRHNTKGYKESDFQGKKIETEFSKATPQYTTYNAPSLQNRTKKNKDDKEWGAELGDEGAQIGIYQSVKNRGRGKEYYLIVKAGANKACQELKDYITQNIMTFGQLVRDPKFVYTKNLARRNAFRLMKNAASALGVSISQIKDRSAGEVHPFRGEPEYVQSVDTIERIDYDGKDAVAIYNRVTPINEINGTFDGNVFIMGHPYEGIYMYPIKNQANGLGLPIDTGKNTEENVSSSSSSSSPRDYTGFIWEHSKDLLHPDLKINAVKHVNEAFENHLVEHGWKRSNRRTHLVPVLLKFSNPDYKR